MFHTPHNLRASCLSVNRQESYSYRRVRSTCIQCTRVNAPRERWQLHSPHSPILPCSCNVVGTRATLDVLSSEHPGQLPPQTLPERVTSTRSAGTRFSASTRTFSSSANGHGSRGQSTCRPRVTAATRAPPYVPTYLCTYVCTY